MRMVENGCTYWMMERVSILEMMERVQDERKGFRRRIGCNNGDMRMEDFQPKEKKKKDIPRNTAGET